MATKQFQNAKLNVTHLDLKDDASRSVLQSGENISHSLGKIARWYKDIIWTDSKATTEVFGIVKLSDDYKSESTETVPTSKTLNDVVKLIKQTGGWNTTYDFNLNIEGDENLQNGQFKVTEHDLEGDFDHYVSIKGLGSAAFTESSAYATARHTHKYAGSDSVGGAATSANKLNTDAGSDVTPIYFSNGIPVACTYSLNKTVPSNALFTDAKVKQTATTTDADYEILFSSTADNTTRTAGARKNSNLTFNPSTGTLTATKFVGTLSGNATSATTANKLSNTTAIGSSIKPVYFSADGIPVAIDHSIETSVPSNAVFTDTTYTVSSGDNNGQIKVTPSEGDPYNVSVKGLGSAAYTDSDEYATAGHTHKYAGSSSAGGVANSAAKLSDIPTAGIGSETKPVFFSGTTGRPVACTYSLNATVPANAIFTDEKVKQSPITTDGSFEVLFAGSTGNTTKTEGVGKTTTLTFNPSTGALSATSFTGNGSGLTSLNASNISSGTLSVNRLPGSAVTIGTYGPAAGGTLSHSGTFDVPDFTVDAKGRITGAHTRTFTLPAQYTHPTHTSKASGLYKITVDSLGHVSGTAAVTKSDIPALDYISSTTTRNPNVVLAGPASGTTAAAPTFRALVAADLPSSGATAGSYGPSENASPAHSGTFSVPYITVDAKGRVTDISTKTIKLPSSGNTDKKVTQTATTTSAAYEVLFSGTADNTTRTEGARKSNNLLFNPSTGVLQISGTEYGAIEIYRKGSAYGAAIEFYNDATANTKTKLGSICMKDVDGDIIRYLANDSTTHKICDTKNTSFTRSLSSGTKIGTITIAGTSTDLYCQTNTNTTYSFATGDTNGTFKVTPSGGTATNIAIKGLGSAAYTASSAYATAGHTHNYAGSSTAGGPATLIAMARVKQDSKVFPGQNRVKFEEYTAGDSYNLPTNAWYHIISMQGADTRYGTQIAIGMTANKRMYFRNYNESSWQDWTRVSIDGHTHSYLPLAGGTMTGNIEFGAVTSTTYPAESKGIIFSGSTDGASIFYRVIASDQGELVLKTRDDGNCIIRMENSATNAKNTIKFDTYNSYIYSNYFNAGCGAETPNTSSYIIYANSDGWLRKSTLANIKTILGLGSAAYTASSAYATSGHAHGLGHSNFTVAIDSTTNTWAAIGVDGTNKYVLKSIRTNTNAPPYLLNGFSAGIVFGGEDTRGVISMKYNTPSIRFAGGNGTAANGGTAKWYITLTGTHNTTYNLDTIHQVTQTATTTDADYEILFSSTADNTTRTEGARKNSNLTFNPSTGILTTDRLYSARNTSTYLAGNKGSAIINSTASAGAYVMLARMHSTNGYFTHGTYQSSYLLQYTVQSTIDAGTNAVTKSVTLLNESGNSSFPGTVTASTFSGSGASLTSLNASNISSGTLSADRLATSGVTAGSYGPSTNASPAHSGTFNVPYITVDNKGRVMAIATRTITLPASGNTDANVKQSATSTANFRGVILGTNNTVNTGDTRETTVTGQGYITNKIFAQPSTGNLYASNIYAYVNGTDEVRITLYRSGNSSWRFVNNGGTLSLQNNYYNSAVQSWYNVAQFDHSGTNAIKLMTPPQLTGTNRSTTYGYSTIDMAICSKNSWAMSMRWLNNARDTTRGEFGAYGTADKLTYYYWGTEYRATKLRLYPGTDGGLVSQQSNGFRIATNGYGVIFRVDSDNFYILLTDKKTDGSELTGDNWNSKRPLRIGLSSGTCNINGNAGSASKIYSTNTPGSSSITRYSIPFFEGPIDSSLPATKDTAATGNKSVLHNSEFRLGLQEGTTSAVGFAQLILGNGIKSGTAGNKYGAISLYSESAYAVKLVTANLTADRTLTLPNAGGTVALTSHTHSYIPTSSAATLFSGTAAASITMTSMSGYTRLVVFCKNTSNSSYFTVELQCTTGYHYHAMTVSPPPAAQTSNSFYGLLFNLSSNTKLSVSAGKYSNLSSSASLANGPTVHITKVLGYKF